MMLVLVINLPCFAGVESKQFDTQEQQVIYKKLIAELRCLVCQNQNIADSNAELAKDLRRQVYEMIQQGKTETDIQEYMIQRYGDFVLYRPQFKLKTGLLWLGPLLFLCIGLAIAFMVIHRKKEKITVELDVEQKEKIRLLLEKEDKV